MSVPHLLKVIELSGRTGRPARLELLTLMIIANYANKATGLAWPSQSTIARHVGVTPRSVWTLTESLQRQKFLVIEKGQAPRGGRGGHRYRLTLEVGFQSAQASDNPPTLEAGFQGEPASTVEAHFQSESGEGTVTLEVTAPDSGSDSGSWLPTTPEASFQRSCTDPRENSTADPSVDAAAAGFLSWWKTTKPQYDPGRPPTTEPDRGLLQVITSLLEMHTFEQLQAMAKLTWAIPSLKGDAHAAWIAKSDRSLRVMQHKETYLSFEVKQWAPWWLDCPHHPKCWDGDPCSPEARPTKEPEARVAS